MKKIFKYSVYFFTVLSIVILLTLVIYLFKESLPFFKNEKIIKFVFGRNWRVIEGNESYQIFNMLYSSFYISILACIISFPLSYGVSLYIAFYLKGILKKIMIWLINILSGIPSVVYGFFGMVVILKKIEKIFLMATGESILAGSIILSIMIIPFFVTNCLESVEEIKKKYEKDSKSLGITKEYFIYNIVLKESKFSVLTGFLLAFSRAIGETMAVMMVIGNSPQFNFLDILKKAETIPALIALEIGMSEVGSKHYSALFASSLVLLIIILVINILIFILNEIRRKYIEK